MVCYTCIACFILSTLDIWIYCINLQQSSSGKVKHSDASVGASEFACGGICLLIKSSSLTMSDKTFYRFSICWPTMITWLIKIYIHGTILWKWSAWCTVMIRISSYFSCIISVEMSNLFTFAHVFDLCLDVFISVWPVFFLFYLFLLNSYGLKQRFGMPGKNLNLWKILQGVARTVFFCFFFFFFHFVTGYQICSLVDHVAEKFAMSIPLLFSAIYLYDISEELLQPLSLQKLPTICRE